jgi:uncharacterized FAD-dependent dehydrogenase
MGDFLRGRRSKVSTFFDRTLGYDQLRPTLKVGAALGECLVVPGDIGLALRGRIVDNLRDTLVVLDRIVPGVTDYSTCLYAPEIKFYDTRYETDRWLETEIGGLFLAGDGVGKSRGIVGAALNGCLVGEGLARKL